MRWLIPLAAMIVVTSVAQTIWNLTNAESCIVAIGIGTTAVIVLIEIDIRRKG